LNRRLGFDYGTPMATFMAGTPFGIVIDRDEAET